MRKRKNIGSFWYQLTQNKNLVGEFIDSVDSKIYTESADWKERDKLDGFTGKYNSSWLELNSPKSMIPEINESHSGIHELTWSDGNRIRYCGEAILSGDGKLVGTYWVADDLL